ncbi:MAG: hypothetical protein U5R46_13365 [Gammaproteobacteria bacterium]|nr:hypothetical protein [Gammaproteobacteria bacterium]
MNGSSTAPHRVVLDRPGFHALVAAASLLLSLWAVYLDPVLNSDGISEVRAAGHFRDAQWRAAIDMAGHPLYAMLGGVVSRVTGMSPAFGLHTVNAGLFALLAVGFTALASVLGGGARARVLAAVLVLLFPALNGFRPEVAGEPGYWAFYVWSLAYFLHYAAARNGRWPAGALLAGIAALFFALEAILFLVSVPLWRWVRDRPGASGRLLKGGAIVAGCGLLLVYALWSRQWHAQGPVGELLLHPLEHLAVAWQELGRGVRFKIESLRHEFLDEYSRSFERTALLATIVVMVVAGIIKALGVVYSALALYALSVSRRVLTPEQRCWWAVFAVVSSMLLLVPAFVEFAVDERDAMVAALTLLAIVPPALERLATDRTAGFRRPRWLLASALVLVLVSGIKGLDLRSQHLHLREAGLWLRAAAAPESSLFSNSQVVVHYSGLSGYRPGADYSWQEAMRDVWRGGWRDYRYLAMVIEAGEAHREGILMRRIDIEPVMTFTGDNGGKVLVFDTKR